MLAGAGVQFFDNNGIPLAGGLVYTYTAGTTTPQAAYTTSAGSIAHANPIVLDSAGRVPSSGEIWLTDAVAYKFVLKTATSTTIGTYDNVTGNSSGVYAAFAASSGSSLVGYTQGGTGAVATTVQARLRQYVSVIDFGADPTGAADATTAFTNAQTASKNVYIPPGTYLLNGLRIQNGVNLIGAGKSAVRINQSVAGTPAINCTSDVSTGQLKNIVLSGFTVYGATSASVAAVLVAAYGAYAIWSSTFDFFASNTFRALEIQGNDASNVFWCEFKITSENTSDVAVIGNGGVYNKFSLFLTQCYKSAYVGNQSAAIFNHLVTEGPITVSDQNSTFNNCTVENMPQFVGTTSYAIQDSGFNNVWNTPLVILSTVSAAKITVAVFKPFFGTIIKAPRFLMAGTAVANPFGTNANSWTIIGPGQNGCTNKIETVYDGSVDIKNLRNVTFVGDCSTFTLQGVPHGGKNVQYLAPSGPFNFNAFNNTDAVIFDFTGTIALANVNIGVTGISLLNNQVISFYSKGTLTTLNLACPAGANVALLPTTMAAGSKFSAVYYSTTNVWYPIG